MFCWEQRRDLSLRPSSGQASLTKGALFIFNYYYYFIEVQTLKCMTLSVQLAEL